MWGGAGNQNFLGEDGLIHNVYVGDQTLAKFEKTIKELQQLGDKLRTEDKRVLVLTDITKLGRVPTNVRQRGLELIRNMRYDKVAIFGGEGVSMQIAKLLVKVSMMDYKIKIFENKKDALDWLLD